MKNDDTRRVGSRAAVGFAVAALMMSACGSGGDDTENTETTRTIVSTATIATTASEVPVAPDSSEPVEAEPVERVEPAENDSLPSLPANIWPEEIVETSEVDTSEVDMSEVDMSEVDKVAGEQDVVGKDVVTVAEGVTDNGVLPAGGGSMTAVVTSADGAACEVCLWLADDDESRQRGLMGVTDLGDAVGMAFVWDQPRTGNFFMFQTPTPLSIAWFDDAGAHVGQADMEPCLVDNSATCERYTADSPYVIAVEMFGGQLDAIGIGPGASIELLDLPCI